MAQVTFIDSATFAYAEPYYSQFPLEPIGSGNAMMRVERVEALRPISVELILSKIIELDVRSGSVLIVSHGMEDGLILPLVRGQRAKAHRDRLNLLSGDRPTREIADGVQLRAPVIDRLRGLMRQVQALRLRRVELRACNVGVAPTMAAIRRFFGAAALGAPAVANTFGIFRRQRISGSPRTWERFSNHVNVQDYDWSPWGRVALWGTSPRRTVLRTGMMAESRRAIEAWATLHLGADLQPRGAWTGEFIAQWRAHVTPHLTFPREPGYRRNLREVS